MNMDQHQWAERSARSFPAASNGEFNLPPEHSMVLREGRGCELWDTTGKRYLDFSMGWGSALVGHANPAVVEAVLNQAPNGSNFAYVNEHALELAEEIIRLSPACDQVRFCASGTEATMYIQRLARGCTGRPVILKFEGAYHGANETGVVSLFPNNPPEWPQPDRSNAGITDQGLADILVAPFNDLETTEAILSKHASRIAGVIAEPLQRCTPPKPGFLEGLRELTRTHDVLLLFDEVVTGFRLAYGGAQEYYGVVPDLVAYGKALGGGYPIGAFGGREDVLSLVREERMGNEAYVWMASSLGGNPISTAAAGAALRVFSQDGTYPRLHAMGKQLREGMNTALQERGIEGQILGDGPLAQVVFSSSPISNYRDGLRADRARGRRMMLELFSRGIFLNPMGTKLYFSLAHTESHLDEFLTHFGAALDAVAAVPA